MTERSLLQWLTGAGWLIFSGGGEDVASLIRSEALARSLDMGGVAYISLEDDGGDATLEDMEDLGAPTGYIISVESEDEEAILDALRFIGVVVIQAGDRLETLYRTLRRGVLAGLQTAYEEGAVILIEGLAVNLFGQWTVLDSGDILAGFDWVKGAIIEPQSTGIEDSMAVRAILAEEPHAIAINIDAGAALALGPGGQIELLGNRRVTISLGSGFENS